MLEQRLRKHYQKLLIEPVLAFLPSTVSPIHITLLSLIIGLLFLPALLLDFPLIAIAILLCSGYLDTLDGSLARYRKQSTNLGSVLDIMADRIVECCVMLAFFLNHSVQHGFAVVMMLITSLLCITSFLVVGIFEKNSSSKSFHYSPGLIERAEAFIFFSLMILLPEFFNYLAAIYCVLVLWTAAIRIKEFAKLTGHT